MQENWIDSYYEALELFYWEPQHLGRKKHATAEFDTLDKVTKHLRRIEVTLNHNISQFFMLAPTALRNELFQELFGQAFKHPFRLHGRGVDTEFDLSNATQPDFLFISAEEVVCVEMKVGAKSGISQVLKYALLGLAAEMRLGTPRRHFLGILGTGEFSNQWQEKFASVSDLQKAISSNDLASFMRTQPVHFREHRPRFIEIVENLNLAFINYPRLGQFIQAAAPPTSDETAGAEVYRKLIGGLLGELTRRDLAA